MDGAFSLVVLPCCTHYFSLINHPPPSSSPSLTYPHTHLAPAKKLFLAFSITSLKFPHTA